jgi:glutamine---fructose-6-phosphate transaminase (isomerizing)
MTRDIDPRGQHTFSEITSQADSWEGVFHRIDRDAERLVKMVTKADDIIIMGCGSGFNISHAVAPVFQKLSGKTCRVVHASDMAINQEMFLNRNRSNLVIVYSRSGDTTEGVLALKKAVAAGAATLTINCFADSKMPQIADTALILEEAVEKSVTTTRSLTAMVLSGHYLAAVSQGLHAVRESLKRLPALARAKMDLFHEMGRKISQDQQIAKYAFLGSGSYYGLAREAQLKVKEMVLLPSDSYVSLDYQHGPMSNVDRQMLVTILVSDAGKPYDLELARNMKSLGGKVFVISDVDRAGFADCADYLIELNTGLSDGVRDILYMPALQFMAYYKSLAVGCDPDNPKNLSYHVELRQKEGQSDAR